MFNGLCNPLDGTTNFIKRLPHFAVSIAVAYQRPHRSCCGIRSYA
ncbi:inositol monophosphatase family protein [Shigella flexneri]